MAETPARPAPTGPPPGSTPGQPPQALTAPGLLGDRRTERVSGSAIVALAATVVWLGLAALYVLVLAPAQGDGAARFVVTLVAVIVPVVLIWVAAAAAQSVLILRLETRRLQAVVEEVRRAWTTERQERGRAAQGLTAERKPAEIGRLAPQTDIQTAVQRDLHKDAHRDAHRDDHRDDHGDAQREAPTAAQRDAEMAAPTDGPTATLTAAPTVARMADRAVTPPEPSQPGFVTSRDTRGRSGDLPRNAARMVGDDQPSLALGTSADELAPPLLTADLIRALNFPETEKDEPGFAALRRALRDRHARQLVQASQDVLTLLSQDGIYMDDLTPDRSHPDIWRRFAQGERGRAVAALGGVRDRSCLALTMGRMRKDTIFRDAAHHFLRLFDRMLVGFEPGASDEDIARLSETRTARAFMLIGRVTGAFD